MRHFRGFFVLLFAVLLAQTSGIAWADPDPINSDVQELNKIKQQTLDLVHSISWRNPFAEVAPSPSPGVSPIPTVDPASITEEKSRYELLKEALSFPGVRAFFNMVTNPLFVGSAVEILKTPHKRELFYAEIGFFILFLILKAWLRSRLSSKNWFRLLWLNLWTSFVYMAVIFFVIPYLFLGTPFTNLVGLVVGTLLKRQ